MLILSHAHPGAVPPQVFAAATSPGTTARAGMGRGETGPMSPSNHPEWPRVMPSWLCLVPVWVAKPGPQV